ncbi:MAG: DUF554 domain-containing protein [Tepidibacter sp.]|jgi:uncharacterized membrane protein YqgA involved in biofilm formation|uniref:DUF554 domain-containing protein n=1 Tax=Tepidibacter sp. TaxID=2529387 RepID=UPI0025FBBEDF|nr:DUF554 domain-containing protein [Tepidibacter sp.]MCT4507326.1 DUF554 domain-containing protein [Tepidibacter sp.]
MLGSLANGLAVLIGSLIGLLFKKGIGENYKKILMDSMGLCIFLIGIMGAIKVQNILLLIVSLAIGSVIGEFLKIEANLDKLGDFLESKLVKNQGSVAKGFVTATLIFCIGSMAIIGALESGLNGNHQTLFAKSIVDGILSIIFASTFGIGVLFSSISVFLYEGFIALAASSVKIFLVDSVVSDISSVGGVLIIAIGLNIMDIKKIKVGNMLPAIFIPLIFFIFKIVYFNIIH